MVITIIPGRNGDTRQRFSHCLLATGLFLSNMFSIAAQAQLRPAESLAREVVALVGSADRAKLRAFVKVSVSDEAFKTAGMMGMPLDVETFLLGIHDRTGALDDVRIESTSPDAATIHGISRLTGVDISIPIRTEDHPPFRLTSIQLSAAPSVGATPLQRDAKDPTKRIASMLDRMTRAGFFSGVVLIVDGEDRILLHRAYGEASREYSVKNSLDTRFNIASMGKMFTAVAILQLAEQRRLSLDDPLTKYLPSFPVPSSGTPILIRQLLSHTSGLGDFLGTEAMRNARTVDEMVTALPDKATAFEPGTDYRYSNTGFLLLGSVVEKVTGQDYFEYVEDHVFKPAGMTDTAFLNLDRINQRVAVGYERAFTEVGREYLNNWFALDVHASPAGGAYSTALDMFRFARALRNGRLLSDASFRVAISPKPNAPRYGYGFFLEDSQRGIVGHAGGFFGAAGALDLFLGNGYTAVYLTNLTAHSGSPFGDFTRQARALILSMPDKRPRIGA